jgi:hypothetical protein
MAWWKRKLPQLGGSVLYRGAPGVRAENFEHLGKSGFDLKRLPDKQDVHWAIEARHPSLGKATVMSARNKMMFPTDLIDFESRLSPEDRVAIKAAGSAIEVLYEPATDHLLKERKKFLRFLHAFTADSTVAYVDHIAQTFWPPDGLADELAHDADVDILALFVVHAVGGDEGTAWMHTHGFEHLGFTEFDILKPAPQVGSEAYDLVRALAFAVVEGAVKPDGPAYQLASPGGRVRLVSSEKVLRRGADLPREWPDMVDPSHLKGHAVVCDPAGWLATFLGAGPHPSRFLSSPIDENLLIHFSTPSSMLMAERARATYPVMRRWLEELKGLPLQPIVKLGYVVDGGGPRDLEHLWFEVHDAQESRIDATLLNAPFNISRFAAGQRAMHDAALLSDWNIMTPAGRVNPLGSLAGRQYLKHKTEILKSISHEGKAS